MTAERAPDPLADVSRETRARLEALETLVRQWSPRINLVARSTLDDLWDRHIRDSAQLAALVPDRGASWLDLGSGAGFPGLVVAILRPDAQVTLVESDARKAAFLRTAARETGTGVEICNARIEALPPHSARVLSARALAPLDRLLGHAARHLAQGGIGLFPKGARAQEELDAAAANWSFRLTRAPSVTDPQSVVLICSEIARAG